MRMVIFGAQGVALGIYKAISIVFSEVHVDCFLVTRIGNNASMIGSLPVRELDEYVSQFTQTEKENTLVLIGTPEPVMEAIEESLDLVGLHNYVRINSARWGKLQELAFVKTGQFMPLSAYLPGCREPRVFVCKMVHEKDKSLTSTFDNPLYMKNLQVGAALSCKTISELRDDIGDSISEKNGNYSELTGLYWMWKNQINGLNIDKADYYGLAHYRRFLELFNDDLARLLINDIDVVLPYPMPYEPDIEAHHLRYLSDIEWSSMLQALEELQPEYSEAFKDILKQGYLYNYNIIVAKALVLDEYCNWLFPILFRTEELANPDGNKQPNRYIGYISETLETLYFLYNKSKLKIAHTCCKFLI